jgi:hypothetical protein
MVFAGEINGVEESARYLDDVHHTFTPPLQIAIN